MHLSKTVSTAHNARLLLTLTFQQRGRPVSSAQQATLRGKELTHSSWQPWQGAENRPHCPIFSPRSFSPAPPKGVTSRNHLALKCSNHSQKCKLLLTHNCCVPIAQIVLQLTAIVARPNETLLTCACITRQTASECKIRR